MKLRKLTKKRSRQLLPSPGDLFAQPPAAFYRLPEFELRGSSLLTRGCRRVLEFGPEKICLDMGSFTVTFYGAALQIESLTGKSLILTGKISEIGEKILYHTAFIETALDDPEHISVDGYGETLKKVVDEIMEAMKRLLDSCDDGRIIKEGVRTVILGKPNAGKSSLLNVLLGEDRAIVTDIAGTTRDVLEEHLNLKGISLNIMDTAGIRDTEDVVEKIGVDRAKEYADKADLILYVIDASRPLDENDAEILHLIKGKRAIILLNKSDLDMQVTKEQEELPEEFPVIEISAKNVQGIEELEDTLKEMFFQGELTFNDEIYITNVRQKTALQDAYAALERVNDSIAADMPEDFYSIDLMDAYEALGNITGETIGEDLVNEIFSKFCMGK